MRAMGRPSKLTPELAATLVSMISDGAYDNVACDAVGIPRGTFYQWLAKGRVATSGAYRDFHDKIKAARTKCHLRWVKHIEGDPSWQSKAWLLERRYPELWGRRTLDINISGIIGKIRHPSQLDALSDDELDKLSDYAEAAGLGSAPRMRDLAELGDGSDESVH